MSHRETETNEFVLVVEDNSINQRVTLLQLEDLGLKAHAVSNGLEALDAVSQSKYMLILMDCQMPEMDGLQATREIRKREKTTGEHVTIIALTAHAMTSDRAECLAAGMDDYISKPVSLRKLAEVLQRWIAKPLNFDFRDSQTRLKNHEAIENPVELDVLFSVFGQDLIADLLVDFISEVDEQMALLRQAVIEKDLATINFIVHDLKGTSATIYATDLTDRSFAMEQYAHTDEIDWNEIDSYLESIESAWNAVRNYLAKNGYNSPSLGSTKA